MLFFTPQSYQGNLNELLLSNYFAENIANKDWMHELDLERAYRRLTDLYDNAPNQPPTPSLTKHTSLLDIIRAGVPHEYSKEEAIMPLDMHLIEDALKMNAGPIPGVHHLSLCLELFKLTLFI